MASIYSCGTCRVKFGALDVMQAHYKCDWHRYNLKRKVADLPPISTEDFAALVLTHQKEVPKDSAGSSEAADKLYCEVCTKSFLSAGSLSSHLESKKHLDRAKGIRTSESEKSDEGDGIVEDVVPSARPDSNKDDGRGTAASHQQKTENDTRETVDNEDDWVDEDDEEDLPPYDVSLCLFCPKKMSTLENNIEHMSASHTFFIPDVEYCNDLTGLIDYLGKKLMHGHMCLYCNARFHDPASVQKHMDSKGHKKMGYEGDFLLEYEEFYDFSAQNKSDVADPVEDEGEERVLDGSGYEMTLPSGATIGHRELNRYYKQKLRPVQDIVLRNNVARHYKALGWNGSDRADYAQQMAKEISRLKHEQQKKALQVGMKANKIQMKHYRRQYGF